MIVMLIKALGTFGVGFLLGIYWLDDDIQRNGAVVATVCAVVAWVAIWVR